LKGNNHARTFALCLSALLLGLATTCSVSFGQGREIRVAAAADLSFAMRDLAVQFEQQSGCKVSLSYGSSGNFFSQIQNGAPFDVFLSADLEYADRLAKAGLTLDNVYEYAVGRLVLWVPANAGFDPAAQHWSTLLAPSVSKIAIANPEHAPYGRAAVAALKKAGIYDRLREKLVYGENISQAAQFVQSGNAQAGLLALSLTLAPSMQSGKSWEVPQDLYPPIRQGAAILKDAKNPEQARRFLVFLRSADARATLRKFGFSAPPLD
jgi:molybdate transport system substrate-binding protein